MSDYQLPDNWENEEFPGHNELPIAGDFDIDMVDPAELAGMGDHRVFDMKRKGFLAEGITRAIGVNIGEDTPVVIREDDQGILYVDFAYDTDEPENIMPIGTLLIAWVYELPELVSRDQIEELRQKFQSAHALTKRDWNMGMEAWFNVSFDITNEIE